MKKTRNIADIKRNILQYEANQIRYQIDLIGRRKFYDFLREEGYCQKAIGSFRRDFNENRLKKDSNFRKMLLELGKDFINSPENFGISHPVLVLLYSNEQNFEDFKIAKKSLENQGFFCIAPQEGKFEKEIYDFFEEKFILTYNLLVVVGDDLPYRKKYLKNKKIRVLRYNSSVYSSINLYSQI